MRKLNFDNKHKKGDEYYVCIDNIEELKNGSFEIILDGVEKRKMEFFNKNSLIETHEEFTPYLFSIIFTKEKILEFLEFSRTAVYKSKWYRLIVTDVKTNLETNVYIDNYDDNSSIIERYVSQIKQIHSNSTISNKLNQYFSWKDFKLGSREQIINSLSNLSNGRNYFLNVYNVGQGSLCALTDINNVPILYYDIGGGFAWNKFTYTNAQTLKLCFNKTKTIIISHWDNDHLETAKRYLARNSSAFSGFTWIAPEQNISPSYFKLAAKLYSAGTLILWPKNMKTYINCWFGKIIKCNGPDKNSSGLALELDTATGKILNPADAAYIHIPYTKKTLYKGLVATHHGANFPINNTPVPRCEEGQIVYSYGDKNRYNHPKKDAVTAHTTAHWNMRLDTVNGHISFGNNSSMPCASIHCNLDIIQTF